MGGKSRKGGKKAAAAARRKAKEEAKKKKEAEAAATAAAAAGAAGAGAGGGAGGGAGASSTNGTPAGGDKIKPGSALHIMLQGVTCTSAKAKYSHANTRDIKVHNLSLALYGSELLMETELTLNWGRRYAIIGPNGCGKSTLLTVIGQRMVPLPRNIDVFHVREEIEPLKDVTALEAVLAVDTEREMLEKEAEDLGESLATLDDDAALEVNERLCEIYERLDEMGADTAKVRAAKLLWGLGFTKEMQATVCADFSGGWRMRIALARALFINPSLLLLDEPTNHLDMEAVVWLENYLAAHKKILLMVSHSQDFLNNVCTNIITVQSQKIVSYAGNYDTYRQTREEIEENQMKRYNWEQDQIKHMKDYIARFGHGSAKLAKQAQSKEKTLAKMERAGLTKKVVSERALSFEFPDPGKIPPPVLQIQNISFHYPGGPLLYNNVDFGVDLDSRIALVGPNGAGKTTMLKLMCGLLTPTQGTVRAHEHLRIARYTQHFVDSLDVSMTPLELMMKRYPDETREQCRSYIGRYGITGVYQTRKIDLLSDGLKSRVVFAFMSRTTPHLLLLDEPTNHLDIETIDALAEAINKFEGGLVLVSHDMRLISQVAKEIWECDHRTMTRFNGDILEYKLELAKRMQQEEAAREKAEERAKEKAKAKAKAAKARS